MPQQRNWISNLYKEESSLRSKLTKLSLFPSSPGPLFQNEGRCSAFDMEIIFHSHANETHFHKKGFAPVPRFESEGFWNSEVAN